MHNWNIYLKVYKNDSKIEFLHFMLLPKRTVWIWQLLSWMIRARMVFSKNIFLWNQTWCGPFSSTRSITRVVSQTFPDCDEKNRFSLLKKKVSSFNGGLLLEQKLCCLQVLSGGLLFHKNTHQSTIKVNYK